MAAAQSSAGCPAWLGCARADVTPFQAGLAALTIVQGAFDARNSAPSGLPVADPPLTRAAAAPLMRYSRG